MELFNFSAAEIRHINRALTFIGRQEVDLDSLSSRTLIVKTENYEDACEEASRYFPGLGIENASSRLVFNTAREGSHKILINKASITGFSYVHAVVTEMVHLGNLSRYTVDHGNIYRFTPEQALADHFYEFLLWSKFQAMRIATRAHALVAWHDINGDASPEGGRYQFAQVAFPSEGVTGALEPMARAETVSAWREGLWDLLEEFALYFGRLSFYQRDPQPAEVDDRFPAGKIEAVVGLANALAFYDILHRCRDYPAWLSGKQAIRRAIVAMQERGKDRYESAT